MVAELFWLKLKKRQKGKCQRQREGKKVQEKAKDSVGECGRGRKAKEERT